MFHYEKRLNLYIITSFLSKHILIGLIFNLCGLFMRLQEITYQIIGFKSNFILPNQWIFLATQTPFHSRFFLKKKKKKSKKTKPRKDNGKNKTLCQHFTCICRWKCGHVLYSLHAESNYCSWEAFSQVESLLVSGGSSFNFGKAQSPFGATSNLYLLSRT